MSRSSLNRCLLFANPLPEPFCRRRVNRPGGTSATRTAEGRAGATEARTEFRQLPADPPEGHRWWFRHGRFRLSILQRPVPSRPGRSCFRKKEVVMFEGQPQSEIDALMKVNPEFKQLYQQHKKLNKKCMDAELGVLPIDDVTLGQMKREKLLAKQKLLRIYEDRVN